MGYTTEFDGQFILNKKLDIETHQYLIKFNESRRMKRDMTSHGAHYGVEGEFYVDGEGFAGQDHEDTVIDYNRPPSTQPGLWCQWRPNDSGTAIQWDGGEKFYHYEQWLKYIIVNFLAPKGYILNGEVQYRGEDQEDFGILTVENNKVFVLRGKNKKLYDEPEEIHSPQGIVPV